MKLLLLLAIALNLSACSVLYKNTDGKATWEVRVEPTVQDYKNAVRYINERP